MTEEWRPVPGYEGHYEISSLGRLRSVKPGRGKRLRTYTHPKQGHTMYTLSLKSVKVSFTAARLVCLAWHGPANGRRAEHVSFDVTDDSVRNVRWASA